MNHYSSFIFSSNSNYSTIKLIFSKINQIFILLIIINIFIQNSNCIFIQQRNGNQKIKGLKFNLINNNNDKQIEQYILNNKIIGNNNNQQQQQQQFYKLSSWNDWNDSQLEFNLRRTALLAKLASQSARGFGK
ncbi:hypothetical protein Mgra_00002232 [Meloidogyne graminicola]|uniref:Uncharacterized protein n=1 Tax=Meloidogyne graminicola TaxID=189291 RepID=A0A8S9ZYB2_9BILA|nr:hypothetical protein Mgra_00002232 [Meloidogyne graminicola]